MKTKKQIENEVNRLIGNRLTDLTNTEAFEAEIKIDCLRWVLSKTTKNKKIFEGLQHDLFDKKRVVKKYYKD